MNTPTQQTGGELERLQKELIRFQEYAFGMEQALRGARASGTATELALTKAECAELRLMNSDLRERLEITMRGSHTFCWAKFDELKAETATLHAQIARLKQREGELVGKIETVEAEITNRLNNRVPPSFSTLKFWATTLRAALQSVAKK